MNARRASDGMITNRASRRLRTLAVAMLPVALLTAGVFLVRDAKPVVAASPDAVKARNRADCVTKSKGIVNVSSVVKLTPPAPVALKGVSFFAMASPFFQGGGDTQWCWGQHCVHTEWWCPSPYDAVDLGPCEVACCGGPYGGCGPSVTCGPPPPQ